MFLGEGLVKPVYLVLLPWAELWATHGLECADYLIILSPRRRLFALENAGCVRKSRANTIQQLNNEWKWVYHLVYCIWPFTVGVAPSAYICNYHNMYIYICIIYIDIDIVIYVQLNSNWLSKQCLILIVPFALHSCTCWSSLADNSARKTCSCAFTEAVSASDLVVDGSIGSQGCSKANAYIVLASHVFVYQKPITHLLSRGTVVVYKKQLWVKDEVIHQVELVGWGG